MILFIPLFRVTDHKSSVFYSFIIKLGRKASGTNVLALGCGHVTMTTMMGVRKKTKDLFQI